ncbi:ABC transporter substrate-binding protein [Paenibacillus radicis (ex Gao et al. 2016)]|uniref:Sulfonate ABC transporter substrate-binding protein n=1 Tax=Paenibacillus radicis (ex Gao et al. 2016) TaxID=1737354 RepID=A0A917M413_9BACL|nr:ABC transporter substrate-binding protein [Paenibacillus radicis (ex Gao et al. 2016)]GGG74111.1 sulfonate ABC transporter substrate-binding protein [Paenibacillus radicis (ex Gao et al. 2016)]
MIRKASESFFYSRRKPPIVILLLSLCLLLSACGQGGAGADSLIRVPVEAGKLKFGYSGNSPIIGLKERGTLAALLETQSVTLEWTAFPNDAALFRAIEEGRIDIGTVGDAVPAFLHRDEAPLVYLAAEPSNPSAYAIVVPLDSDIFTAADLKGKRVAYSSYSNEHLLLLQVLADAGMTQKDVKALPLDPAGVQSSIVQRKADAWVVGEPQLSWVEPLGIRIVADSSQAVARRDLIVTTPDSLQGREAIFDLALQEIGAYDDWLTDNVHDAAELLTSHTDIEHIQWLGVFERKAYGTAPLLESIAKEEQEVADTAVKLGGAKKSLDVQRFLKR